MLLKLTIDRHETSRGVSATAELLVNVNYSMTDKMPRQTTPIASLFRQPLADDEVATRLRRFSLQSLVRFTASPMLSSISLTSSFILSIHFFGGLPLFPLPLIVRCPRWQTSFIHSWHVTEPGKSSSRDFINHSFLLLQSISYVDILYPVSPRYMEYFVINR